MLKKISFFLFFAGLGYCFLLSVLAIYKVDYYYLYSLFGILFGFLIFLFKLDTKKVAYNNEDCFRFPLLSKNYYKSSFKCLGTVLNLVLFSLLLALALLVSLIKIPSFFPILHVSLVYLVFALAALMFGPFYGVIFGLLTDVLSYLISPPPFPFFFGYTFNKMFECFLFGLIFFKTKISFTKTLLAMFLVNFLINAVFGSIWWGMISDYPDFKTYYNHFITVSLPKNLMFFIPQTLLLYFFFYFLRPLLYKFKFINEDIYLGFGII